MVKSLFIFLTALTVIGQTEVFAADLSYKNSSYFRGQIPEGWNEYSNGFGYISESASKEVIGKGGGSEDYARYVSYSVSPNVICFSDVPEDRIDVFKISEEEKKNLIAKDSKTGNHAVETIGRSVYETISFSKIEEGGIQKEYFSPARKDSSGRTSYDLIIQYQGSPEFNEGSKNFIATLEN